MPSASAPVGSGTYITGPTSGVGLDVSPQNNFSLKTYNETTGNFDGVLNTKTLSISGSAAVATVPDNFGYFMFVRGDRSAANVNAFTPGAVVNETTLRDTGLLQIKSYTFPANGTVGLFKLIGNPYASPVDFALVTKNNVADKCWTWDPNLNVVGGYVLFDASTAIPYAPTKVPLTNTGTVQQTQIIQSKQAFLVQTTGASAPSITFTEASKSSTNNLLAFRPVTRRNAPVLAINLYQQNANNANVLIDGAVIQCAQAFNNNIDALDGLKFTNINENIGIVSHNKVLMLERRQPFAKGDTVFLKINRVTQRSYQLQMLGKDISRNNLSAYLVDAFTKSSTAINLEGQTLYEYEVNSNTASANPNRFYIVFAKTVHYTQVQATVQQHDVTVQWNVQDEKDMVTYTIERSTNNIDFESISTQNAKANNSSEIVQYQCIDANPLPGIYFYRIKATSITGQLVYSNAVQVQLVNTAKQMYVFPNPIATATMQVQLNNKAAGVYALQLVQANGQIVVQTVCTHKGGTATLPITLPANIANGNYKLTVTEPNKKATIIPVFVSKN